MKRISIVFALLLFAFLANAQRDKKVAVFDPDGTVTTSIKNIVREEMSNAMVNNSGYSVVERSMIDKVLAESKFQGGGLVDDNQISELGKMMGADYVCYGSIEMPATDYYYMSFKMVDVMTAKVVMQKTGSTKTGVDGAVKLAGELASVLIGGNLQTVVVSNNNNNKVNEVVDNSPGGKMLIMFRPKPSETVTLALGAYLKDNLGSKYSPVVSDKAPFGSVKGICVKAEQMHKVKYVSLITFTHSGRTWYYKVEMLDAVGKRRIGKPYEVSLAKKQYSQNEFFKNVLDKVKSMSQ